MISPEVIRLIELISPADKVSPFLFQDKLLDSLANFLAVHDKRL